MITKSKLFFGRKGDGQTSTMLTLFYLMMFATLLLLGIKYVYSAASGRELERTYTARDVALVMSTLQAAPSELVYYKYPANLSKNGLTVLIHKDNVTVLEESGLQSVFFFPNTLGISVEEMEFKEEIKLKKNENKILEDENGKKR
ncbi:MAG: hypothetical protein QXW00_04260 [Candidatus Woesearchaeota archaeon]